MMDHSDLSFASLEPITPFPSKAGKGNVPEPEICSDLDFFRKCLHNIIVKTLTSDYL